MTAHIRMKVQRNIDSKLKIARQLQSSENLIACWTMGRAFFFNKHTISHAECYASSGRPWAFQEFSVTFEHLYSVRSTPLLGLSPRQLVVCSISSNTLPSASASIWMMGSGRSSECQKKKIQTQHNNWRSWSSRSISKLKLKFEWCTSLK